MKDLLTQSEVTSKRCKWITRIQEFNLEIHITKLVRGLGLAKLMTEENMDLVQVNNEGISNLTITSIEMQPYYVDVVYFIKNARCTEHMTDNQKRTLRLQA